MTNTTNRLTGAAAIAYAEARGLKLNKHTDPTESARSGLSIDEAREISREDPSLIYLDVPAKRTTATLTFVSFFNGEKKGEHQRRVKLSARSIVAALRENSGQGHGCRVVMTEEQLAAAGGYVSTQGFGVLTLDDGYKDDRIDIVRPAHRPRRDPTAARVNLVVRVHPSTRARLETARARTGEGLGALIDKLVALLPD